MHAVYVVCQRELIRFFRQHSRWLGALFIPLLLLVLFGVGFGAVLNQGWDFARFLYSGIIAYSIVSGTRSAASTVIWDREFGFLRVFLMAPVSLSWLVAGKVIGIALQQLISGAVFLLLAPLARIQLDPLGWLYSLLSILLLSIGFSGVSCAVAARSRTYESYNTWMEIIAIPALFISGAYFPIKVFPTALRLLASLNPLSYGIDSLKHLFLGGRSMGVFSPDFGFGWDLAILVLFAGLGMVVALAMFPRREN